MSPDISVDSSHTALPRSLCQVKMPKQIQRCGDHRCPVRFHKRLPRRCFATIHAWQVAGAQRRGRKLSCNWTAHEHIHDGLYPQVNVCACGYGCGCVCVKHLNRCKTSTCFATRLSNIQTQSFQFFAEELLYGKIS